MLFNHTQAPALSPGQAQTPSPSPNPATRNPQPQPQPVLGPGPSQSGPNQPGSIFFKFKGVGGEFAKIARTDLPAIRAQIPATRAQIPATVRKPKNLSSHPPPNNISKPRTVLVQQGRARGFRNSWPQV